MHKIKTSDVVKFSNRILELCVDLGHGREAIQRMRQETFLVINVFEDVLEADVLAATGDVQRYGVHDLEIIEAS